MYQGLTKDVSLTTKGRDSWDWVGRLLGKEHASTSQSGVEAPRLLKRSLSRLFVCLFVCFFVVFVVFVVCCFFLFFFLFCFLFCFSFLFVLFVFFFVFFVFLREVRAQGER